MQTQILKINFDEATRIIKINPIEENGIIVSENRVSQNIYNLRPGDTIKIQFNIEKNSFNFKAALIEF